ncbi:unnamed protein product [Rotaria sp. Silwood1]|nr:unnamed protein product [Rotaria sp. Silwood1]
MLCETMTTYVAEYFEKLEKKLRETKYKNQIESLKETITELGLLEEEKNNQIILSGLEQQLLDGILDEGTLANRHECDREFVDSLLERASSKNPRLIGYMQRAVAYHHAGFNNKSRVAVEALFSSRYVQVIFSTATLGM